MAMQIYQWWCKYTTVHIKLVIYDTQILYKHISYAQHHIHIKRAKGVEWGCGVWGWWLRLYMFIWYDLRADLISYFNVHPYFPACIQTQRLLPSSRRRLSNWQSVAPALTLRHLRYITAHFLVLTTQAWCLFQIFVHWVHNFAMIAIIWKLYKHMYMFRSWHGRLVAGSLGSFQRVVCKSTYASESIIRSLIYQTPWPLVIKSRKMSKHC